MACPVYKGYIGDNGKENGSYYLGSRVSGFGFRGIFGLYRGYLKRKWKQLQYNRVYSGLRF